MSDRQQLDAHLASQRGAATVRQLEAAGIDDHERMRALAAGYLEKIGARTYRSGITPHTLEDDLAALVVDCGPTAVASGPTAAALHGFDGYKLRRPFHITVNRGRNVQRVGVHIHTTSQLPRIDLDVVRRIPVTSGARTVIDLGRHSSRLELTRAIDSMIRDGSGSEELLHRRIVALRGKGRSGIGKVIAAVEGQEVSRGGQSYLERRYLELIAAAGLPRPNTQVHVNRANDRINRVDCAFPGTPVVVELLGYRWHRTEAQMSRDTERMNAMLLSGLVPVQFTYRQVVEQGGVVVGVTASALATKSAA